MTIAAFRYNNPFDVSLPMAGWKGGGDIVGIQGQKGYAAFPDMATGMEAGKHRLNSYISGQSSYGPLTTIKDLNSVYATDPNWSAGVAKFSGIGPGDKLDPTNQDQMAKLQYGVLAQEIGPENAAKVLQGQGASAPAPTQNNASVSPAAAPSPPLNITPTGIPQAQAPIFAPSLQQVAQAQPQMDSSAFQMPQAPQIYYAPRRQIDLSQLRGLTQAPIFSRG